jgi:MerR family mercuric resistance operon transcriptional regulator
MSGQYTISELAKAVGVPATTLRYYERARLVTPEGRSEGNYRLYSDTSLQRLRFIRAAQAIGFTLDDVKMLLGNKEGRMAPCREVQALIHERLLGIEQQLGHLRSVQRVLKASLEKCRASEKKGCCHVVESLKEASARHKERV